MKVLLIDNYDSFTYMLKDYIEQCGASCRVIRNDEVPESEWKQADVDAIILSPGPQTPAQAGMLMQGIEYFHKTKPILGVCLGHQALGVFFGAQLVKARLPRHGKVDQMQHNGETVFNGVPQHFEATRYHSLVLQNLPHSLQVTCSSGGEVMALKHRHLPLWGIQFHPESCQTASGFKIIQNFIELAKQFKRP